MSFDLYTVCIGIMLFMLLFVIARMIKGPTVMDRILCFDALSISIVGVMVLLSMKWDTGNYVDIILIFSLFGFFGTVIFGYYLYKTYERHEDEDLAKGMTE